MIYKQTLIPLSEYGETVIFKNRYYGVSTSFTKDEKELAEHKPENYKQGKNARSNEHLNLFTKNEHDRWVCDWNALVWLLICQYSCDTWHR